MKHGRSARPRPGRAAHTTDRASPYRGRRRRLCRGAGVTGEVEIAAGDVRGLAVHLAARVMALAAPNQVYVSATTRELVADSGLTFVDAGIQELTGISGARQLYCLAAPQQV
ncbi:MAG: hypothetical protein ACLQBX_08080 [Candidatus Limnocylindrales bacterium]|jgi:class 3 adenylate cyclase